MIIKTISDKGDIKYKHYINKPMQIVERRLNMIAAKNTQLVILFD